MSKLLWWIALNWVLLLSSNRKAKDTKAIYERTQCCCCSIYSRCARLYNSGWCSFLFAVMTLSVTIMKIVLIKWNEHHHRRHYHKTGKNCWWVILFGFECFSMRCNGKHTNTHMANTIAANIKSGFIKFPVHFACFILNAPREKFQIEMEMQCSKGWSKQKEIASWLFLFDFLIQLYGFACP